MTGGRVIVIGETGRSFAAGMSGGIAYVLNESGKFEKLVNKEMVLLEEPNAEGQRIHPDDLGQACRCNRFEACSSDFKRLPINSPASSAK